MGEKYDSMSSPEGSLKRMQVSVKTGSFTSFSSRCSSASIALFPPSFYNF